MLEQSALYPYPSRRYAVYAPRGMCATSNHLAAQAGLDMLKQGGNAFDAAIAAAACLTVLEPQSNGAGSDAFAIFSQKGGPLHGMNSTGVMDAKKCRAWAFSLSLCPALPQPGPRSTKPTAACR